MEVMRGNLERAKGCIGCGLCNTVCGFTVPKKVMNPSPGRFVAVRAAFDNKTFSEPYNMFEEDPELAERLYNVVLEFSKPIYRRKKPTIGKGPITGEGEKK